MKAPTISVNDLPEIPITQCSDQVLIYVAAHGCELVDYEGNPDGTPEMFRSIASGILRERDR